MVCTRMPNIAIKSTKTEPSTLWKPQKLQSGAFKNQSLIYENPIGCVGSGAKTTEDFVQHTLHRLSCRHDESLIVVSSGFSSANYYVHDLAWFFCLNHIDIISPSATNTSTTFQTCLPKATLKKGWNNKASPI